MKKIDLFTRFLKGFTYAKNGVIPNSSEVVVSIESASGKGWKVTKRKGVNPVDPLSISGIPDNGTVGSPYLFSPIVSGGAGVKSFTLSGSLPSGLSFSSSTGDIFGNPSSAGVFLGLSIAVHDASGSATLSSIGISIEMPFMARPIIQKTGYPANVSGSNPYNHSRPPVYTNISNVVVDELRVCFSGFAVTASSDSIASSQPILYKAGYQQTVGGAKISGTQVLVNPNGFGYSVIHGCNIQPGASFYLNCRAETMGTTPTQFTNSAPARLAYSGSDSGDYTIPGSPQQPTGGGSGIIPVAVIGYARGLPINLIAVYGDSIAAGAVGFPFMDQAIRAAGLSVINGAVSGAQANGQVLTNRIAIARGLGADVAISNYGINDARNGRTVAQIKSSLQTIWVSLRSSGHSKIFHCTLTPETTRIDASQPWTEGNQQSIAATMAIVNPINQWIRSGADGLIDGFFDYSDVVSTSRDSGIFKSGYTADGLHPSESGAEDAKVRMTAFVLEEVAS